MPTITLSATIHAPISRCFDLARSIDFHTHSMRGTGERAIAGRTSGLIAEGEEVTWQARHFGLVQRLTSRVSVCRPPQVFIDEQVRGPFRSFRHEHRFEPLDERATRLTDIFTYRAPLGPLGRIAEAAFVTGTMRRLLQRHQEHLKAALESEEWRRFLPGEPLRIPPSGPPDASAPG
ncbi:MAG TPA: SRPBCC family protein [Phycisphaerales bacterium]|nr:SRPBCC family protein [Phycisphaerales bacterium]